ncbi:MAG: type II toxin-antitoxin system RelE/ParE family toxin [Terriglobales bacterium]
MSRILHGDRARRAPQAQPIYSLYGIYHLRYILYMAWEVEFTDEFGGWWNELNEDEQTSIDRCVLLLEQFGPGLTRPYADTVRGSEFANMRELRVQHEGRPFRILYAFDPRRTGILLLGGDKTGNARWYEEMVPKADALFTQHLREIKKKE